MLRLVGEGQQRVPGCVLLDAGRRGGDGGNVRRLQQSVCTVGRHAGRLQRRQAQLRRAENVRRGRRRQLHLRRHRAQGIYTTSVTRLPSVIWEQAASPPIHLRKRGHDFVLPDTSKYEFNNCHFIAQGQCTSLCIISIKFQVFVLCA